MRAFMEWIVTRVFHNGRVIGNAHLRQAGAQRGRVLVEERQDADRKRLVRVARMIPPSSAPPLPELLDVQMVGGLPERWSLTGLERIAGGPLGEAHLVAQTWLLEPAPDQDLREATTEIARLRRLLVAHGIDPKSTPPNQGSR